MANNITIAWSAEVKYLGITIIRGGVVVLLWGVVILDLYNGGYTPNTEKVCEVRNE